MFVATAGRAEAQGFGIKGGVVFPDFKGEDVDFDNKTGWQVGLFIGGNRPGIFGFQAEVNWLRKEVSVPGLPSGGTGTATLDYLQVPVLLRLNIGTKSKGGFAFYGIAGPSFETKIGDDVSGFAVAVPDDAFANFDFGVMLGGGMEIARVIFEGRYTWGLQQLIADFVDFPSSGNVKVNTFAILVGIRFN